ncbi:MAG: tail fiber protein [Bacteroidota bacterium]
MVGFNFAPRGWALCDGTLLPINQYQALFSLLGTIYGGDGRTTFALPDLRGRMPMHVGTGPGLSPRSQGQRSGSETETLTTGQVPAHSHPVSQVQVRGTGSETVGLATGGDQGTSATATSGGGQSHNNMPPFLVVNFVIALQGLFPSRS